jgi:hypothetical protein
MLIRVLAKTLRAGISVEIVSQKLVIEPGATSEMHVLLDTLDGHYRHIHGIKTHPADTAPQGRKRLLDPDKLPEIRAKLDKPGATATDVAQEPESRDPRFSTTSNDTTGAAHQSGQEGCKGVLRAAAMMLMSRSVMRIKDPFSIFWIRLAGIALRSASSSVEIPVSLSNTFTRSPNRDRKTTPLATQTPSVPPR